LEPWRQAARRDFFVAASEAGRYALIGKLGSFALYTRMAGPRVLEHATREKIFGHIRSKPGVHYRSLLREMDVSNGTLVHHLRTLEREKLIRRQRQRLRVQFYAAGAEPRPPALPLAELLTPSQATLLEYVLAHPGCTQSDVARALEVSRQAVHQQVKDLRQRGWILATEHGRATRLRGSESPVLRVRRCGVCGNASLASVAVATACPHCGASSAEPPGPAGTASPS
jgi:predicted transcriptional regulator